jgi:hypothetical protein
MAAPDRAANQKAVAFEIRFKKRNVRQPELSLIGCQFLLILKTLVRVFSALIAAPVAMKDAVI